MRKNLNPLDSDKFEKLANRSGVLILDVRNQIQFAEEHIPGSIFIGIDGGFAPWVGAIVGDVKRPILLITPKGKEEETITRLARVGFDNTLGFLEGGLSSWKAEGRHTDSITTIEASNFGKKIGEGELQGGKMIKNAWQIAIFSPFLYPHSSVYFWGFWFHAVFYFPITS